MYYHSEEHAYVENRNHVSVNVPVKSRSEIDPGRVRRYMGPAVSHATGEVFELIRYLEPDRTCRLTAIRLNLFANNHDEEEN